ncbi:MAG TPA: penicillin-binding protein 1C [Candidatus Aquilonibacter sp.]|nr:penicillin-binding protein 1C [Candidatus Aquilonibacter sp.]
MQIFFRFATALCALVLAVAYLGGRDVSRLPHTARAETFLDRTGAPLGTILASDSAHAVYVPLARVSPAFVQAVVAAEDARFRLHGAIDLAGLARAAREYFVYGAFESGGSTIPMQLARLLHPTPSTIRGKLVQIAVAERIAMRSEKRDILEAYVNRAPMGGNLYGVDAAARTYFGTPARDLDLAQSTLLAGVPNDPSRLAPDTHLGAARVRQQYVLGRMTALGEIDAAAAKSARSETLTIGRHDDGIIAAPHALFYLFPRVNGAGRVRTTIDRGLQRFVQAQIGDVLGALTSRHVSDAAVLVADNHTGEVLAYAGSPDYFSDALLGRNDGVQALRQPGSSLKPFTYERALETGAIQPTTILADTPVAFAISNGKLYQPADYSGTFSGPVRVRYALANSLNVPAVRVLSKMGTQTLLDRLHDLGFSHLDKPASYYGLGLTLGSGEVSLWENVQAYVTIARDGSFVPLHLVPQTCAARQIGDPPTWELVTDMLADPHAREHSFGRHSVLDLPFDAAVKTGTSSDFRDTWTIGFTRDYTVGVWVGNFDGSPMRGISGVTGAGPLWNRIMLHLHERRETAPFDKPAGYVRARICATTGVAPARGCPAVVWEWVKPVELARLRRSAPVAQAAHLRIVSPADGSVFYHNDAVTSAQRAGQQLTLHAAGNRSSIVWTVNGARVASDADGNAFVPAVPGTYTIVARSEGESDRVTVRVVEHPRQSRPGFSFTRP